jgi:metal-dependent hydrolase (beta-lactamase superfamily II)
VARKRNPKKAAELLGGMHLVRATMQIADAIEALND